MSTPHLDPLVSAIAEAVIERIGARVTALRPRLLTRLSHSAAIFRVAGA
jgi:hypothetical protein